MNKETLENILKAFEQYRYEILKGSFDLKTIMIGMISFMIEQIKYDLERKRSENIYK